MDEETIAELKAKGVRIETPESLLGRPFICEFCKKDLIFLDCCTEDVLEQWGLLGPIHTHCAIEALIDRKFNER